MRWQLRRAVLSQAKTPIPSAPPIPPRTTQGEQLDSPAAWRSGCHGNGVSGEGARSPPGSAIFLCRVPSGTPWRPSCSSQRPTSLSQTGCRHPKSQEYAESRTCSDCKPNLLPNPSEHGLSRDLERFASRPSRRSSAAQCVRHFLPTGPAARALFPIPAAARSCLISRVGIMAATATMATSGSARKRLLKEEDMTKVEFETSEEVDVTPTFDTMGLREDLLRGIYAYGGARASRRGRLGAGRVRRGGNVRPRARDGAGSPGPAVSQALPVARVADNHVCVPVRCPEALMGKSGL